MANKKKVGIGRERKMKGGCDGAFGNKWGWLCKEGIRTSSLS